MMELIPCCVLNDLSIKVGVPNLVLEQVKKSTGLEPVWPIGVYLLFTEDGLTLGIYGKNSLGELQNATSDQSWTDTEVPDLGEELWAMWKKYRSVPDSVIEENWEKLKI